MTGPLCTPRWLDEDMLTRLTTVLPNLFHTLQHATPQERTAAIEVVCRFALTTEVGTSLPREAMAVLSSGRTTDNALLAALAAEVATLDEAYFELDAVCRDERSLTVFRQARVGAALCFALGPMEDAWHEALYEAYTACKDQHALAAVLGDAGLPAT